MKELIGSLDAALQMHLPLATGPREATAGRRRRSSFSESRDSLIRRLVDPELRLREVALLLSVCPATVRRYAKRGILPYQRTAGNQRRFRLSDIVDFLRQRQAGAADSGSSPPVEAETTLDPPRLATTIDDLPAGQPG